MNAMMKGGMQVKEALILTNLALTIMISNKTPDFNI